MLQESKISDRNHQGNINAGGVKLVLSEKKTVIL